MSFVDAVLASPLAARPGGVFLHFLWNTLYHAGNLNISVSDKVSGKYSKALIGRIHIAFPG